MTHAAKSPVTRETSALSRRRPLIVTVESHSFFIREKGRRECFALPIDAAYDLALKLHARAAAQEKKTARTARKGGAN